MINLSTRRRKKKVEEPVVEETEEPVEEKEETAETTTEEQTPYKDKVDFGEPFEVAKEISIEKTLSKPKKGDMVKVKVLVGTLQWEEGTYSKGDVFETTRERAERFSSTSVEIL